MSHLHDATVEFNHAETNKTRRDEIDASWPCTPTILIQLTWEGTDSNRTPD